MVLNTNYAILHHSSLRNNSKLSLESDFKKEVELLRNPRVTVDLQKLRKNIAFITSKLHEKELSITAVTKVFQAEAEIIRIYDEFPEIEYFGDSRIENLMSYQDSPKKKILIRIPMQSELAEVVAYADVSFHSELATLRLLEEEAKKQGKKHQVLLMVDLGDLREGFFDREELFTCIADVLTYSHLELVGIGVNLTCYGAIIPDSKNLSQLVEIKDEIAHKFGIELPMISGGNSSSLYLIDSSEDYLPEGITNLRIGEAFVLGRETAYEADYPEMAQDVFTLKAEIVEAKTKPSYPIGNIGVDAFGNKPHYEDEGMMYRCILGIGRQDVSPGNIIPRDSRIKIMGASSDHLIIDCTAAKADYQVGDEVEFDLTYGSLLRVFTSKYVKKEYIDK